MSPHDSHHGNPTGGNISLEGLRSLDAGTHLEVIDARGRRTEGWLLPTDLLSDPHIVRLKLASGYNVGLRVDEGTTLRTLPGRLWGEAHGPPLGGGPPPVAARPDPAPDTVALLTTGGTIASRVDYVTGGVHPVVDPSQLESIYPGIGAGGPLEVRAVAEMLSEDMSPSVWDQLSAAVVEEFARGVRGVVITHGTDTLSYTAAALAFQLRDLPGPVVLTGAQRSIDRPSSDGIENLVGSVRVAREANLGEVVVVMHDGPSDGRLAIHRGSRVRKMHASRRDAFHSPNSGPLGHTGPSELSLSSAAQPRRPGPARREGGFREEAGLLWFRPGLTPEEAENQASRTAGLILAGTGMGHVAIGHLPWIRRATDRGVVIAMTTQCLGGEVDPFVYSRGRELLRAGVVYLGDLTPEIAYVKLLWALGNSRDPAGVRRWLLQDVAGELETRRGLVSATSSASTVQGPT